jgi:hypothetical protein
MGHLGNRPDLKVERGGLLYLLNATRGHVARASVLRPACMGETHAVGDDATQARFILCPLLESEILKGLCRATSPPTLRPAGPFLLRLRHANVRHVINIRLARP